MRSALGAAIFYRMGSGMSGLVGAVAVLCGRDLTAEESQKLAKFQDQQSIGDDDPIVAILALLEIGRAHV